MKQPRKSSDYRGARRNAVRDALHDYRVQRMALPEDKRDERGKWSEWWPGARPTHVVSHPPVRPNRSRKFDAVD